MSSLYENLTVFEKYRRALWSYVYYTCMVSLLEKAFLSIHANDLCLEVVIPGQNGKMVGDY